MRYEYYKLARLNGIGFNEIYFKPDSLETAICNNGKRTGNEKIPENVIHNMNTKLQAPNPFQNAWEQFSFTIKVQSNEQDINIYNCE